MASPSSSARMADSAMVEEIVDMISLEARAGYIATFDNEDIPERVRAMNKFCARTMERAIKHGRAVTQDDMNQFEELAAEVRWEDTTGPIEHIQCLRKMLLDAKKITLQDDKKGCVEAHSENAGLTRGPSYVAPAGTSTIDLARMAPKDAVKMCVSVNGKVETFDLPNRDLSPAEQEEASQKIAAAAGLELSPENAKRLMNFVPAEHQAAKPTAPARNVKVVETKMGSFTVWQPDTADLSVPPEIQALAVESSAKSQAAAKKIRFLGQVQAALADYTPTQQAIAANAAGKFFDTDYSRVVRGEITKIEFLAQAVKAGSDAILKPGAKGKEKAAPSVIAKADVPKMVEELVAIRPADYTQQVALNGTEHHAAVQNIMVRLMTGTEDDELSHEDLERLQNAEDCFSSGNANSELTKIWTRIDQATRGSGRAWPNRTAWFRARWGLFRDALQGDGSDGSNNYTQLIMSRFAHDVAPTLRRNAAGKVIASDDSLAAVNSLIDKVDEWWIDGFLKRVSINVNTLDSKSLQIFKKKALEEYRERSKICFRLKPDVAPSAEFDQQILKAAISEVIKYQQMHVKQDDKGEFSLKALGQTSDFHSTPGVSDAIDDVRTKIDALKGHLGRFPYKLLPAQMLFGARQVDCGIEGQAVLSSAMMKSICHTVVSWDTISAGVEMQRLYSLHFGYWSLDGVTVADMGGPASFFRFLEAKCLNPGHKNPDEARFSEFYTFIWLPTSRKTEVMETVQNCKNQVLALYKQGKQTFDEFKKRIDGGISKALVQLGAQWILGEGHGKPMQLANYLTLGPERDRNYGLGCGEVDRDSATSLMSGIDYCRVKDGTIQPSFFARDIIVTQKLLGLLQRDLPEDYDAGDQLCPLLEEARRLYNEASNELSMDIVDDELTTSLTVAPLFQLKGGYVNEGGIFNDAVIALLNEMACGINPAAVDKFCAAGFPRDQVIPAVNLARGDADVAEDYLFNGMPDEVLALLASDSSLFRNEAGENHSLIELSIYLGALRLPKAVLSRAGFLNRDCSEFPANNYGSLLHTIIQCEAYELLPYVCRTDLERPSAAIKQRVVENPMVRVWNGRKHGIGLWAYPATQLAATKIVNHIARLGNVIALSKNENASNARLYLHGACTIAFESILAFMAVEAYGNKAITDEEKATAYCEILRMCIPEGVQPELARRVCKMFFASEGSIVAQYLTGDPNGSLLTFISKGTNFAIHLSGIEWARLLISDTMARGAKPAYVHALMESFCEEPLETTPVEWLHVLIRSLGTEIPKYIASRKARLSGSQHQPSYLNDLIEFWQRVSSTGGNAIAKQLAHQCRQSDKNAAALIQEERVKDSVQRKEEAARQKKKHEAKEAARLKREEDEATAAAAEKQRLELEYDQKMEALAATWKVKLELFAKNSGDNIDAYAMAETDQARKDAKKRLLGVPDEFAGLALPEQERLRVCYAPLLEMLETLEGVHKQHINDINQKRKDARKAAKPPSSPPAAGGSPGDKAKKRDKGKKKATKPAEAKEEAKERETFTVTVTATEEALHNYASLLYDDLLAGLDTSHKSAVSLKESFVFVELFKRAAAGTLTPLNMCERSVYESIYAQCGPEVREKIFGGCSDSDPEEVEREQVWSRAGVMATSLMVHMAQMKAIEPPAAAPAAAPPLPDAPQWTATLGSGMPLPAVPVPPAHSVPSGKGGGGRRGRGGRGGRGLNNAIRLDRVETCNVNGGPSGPVFTNRAPAAPRTLADVPDLSRPSAESTVGGETTCIVCMEHPKDHVCNPCGHMCVCQSCSTKLKLCPYCRGPAAGWLKVRQV